MPGRIKDNDDLIISLLKANDAMASALLYQTHYHAIYYNVRRFIRDPDQAKDITQELFINVWEKRSVLSITKPIRKYLLSAAHNRVINFNRDAERNSKLRNEVADRSSLGRIVNSADVEYEANELKQIIKDAINLLPEKLRSTFMMSRYLGMTYKEMALHLKVSDKAVEKRMTSALKLLRILLAPYLKILLVLPDLEIFL